MPVREHLEHGARLNPHGSGFALGYIAKHFTDPEKAIAQFMAHRERFLHLPALFHSRNATGDSPVTPENIHPFEVNLPWGKAFVAHNGYLFKHEGDRSDSRIFAEEILPLYNMYRPRIAGSAGIPDGAEQGGDPA
jgi:predicted glutamine amidotransferase